VTRITGISQAILRNEKPLSMVLPQFLQWVTSVTAEVSDTTSTTHFPGIPIDFFILQNIIYYIFILYVCSVSCP